MHQAVRIAFGMAALGLLTVSVVIIGKNRSAVTGQAGADGCGVAEFAAVLGTPESQGWSAFPSSATDPLITVSNTRTENGVSYIRISDESTARGARTAFESISNAMLSDRDWTLEMKSRTVESVPGDYVLGMNMLLATPDGKSASLFIDTNMFGTQGPSATSYEYGPHINRTTTDGFHIYTIKYKKNGAGTPADDTFDVYFDGAKVLANITRPQMYQYAAGAGVTGVSFGIGSSPGKGVMDVSYVRFKNDEPSCPSNPFRHAQCSDGEDNDGDGTVDMEDPDCHSDGVATNTGSFLPLRTTEAPLQTTSSSLSSSSRTTSSSLRESSSSSFSSSSAVQCGDGKRQSTETCDDGNTASGDGCSADCRLETGWRCNGNPSTCSPLCGDGIRMGSEGCDDGNTQNNDGCSLLCRVEFGWTCTGTPSLCARSSSSPPSSSSSSSISSSESSSFVAPQPCGDGVRNLGEECDDRNTVSGDGCSATCFTETGWICAGTPSQCLRLPASASSSSPVTVPAQSSAAPVARSSSAQSSAKLQPAAPASSNAPSSAGLSFATSSPMPVAVQPSMSSLSPLLTLTVPSTSSSSAMSQAPLQAWKPACGNGLLEIGETCDLGSANSDKPGTFCTTSCTRPQTQTLAANTVATPVALQPATPVQSPLVAQLQPQIQYVYPGAPLYQYPPKTPSSGPGSLAAMAAGAAAGAGWMRKKKR